MSGSGKSSVALAVAEHLRARALPVEVLDSGRIRSQINRSLGFSREEIEENTLRLAYECTLLNRNGVVAIVGSVSPYREVRDRARDQIGTFVEVYCRCPMEVLAKRDKSGLFEKAMKGEIAHVAGVNAPYEEPPKPEVLLNTDQLTVDEAALKVITTLEVLGRLERVEQAAYTAEEEAMIRRRLQDLGYL
jgi:adenylylsulfate kinase